MRFFLKWMALVLVSGLFLAACDRILSTPDLTILQSMSHTIVGSIQGLLIWKWLR